MQGGKWANQSRWLVHGLLTQGKAERLVGNSRLISSLRGAQFDGMGVPVAKSGMSIGDTSPISGFIPQIANRVHDHRRTRCSRRLRQTSAEAVVHGIPRHRVTDITGLARRVHAA
jgi:hypothetical protein